MDPKSTWPVVKFLIAATGFKRREARRLLDEIPNEKYSQLFIRALAWDRDTSRDASKALEDLLGNERIHSLEAATARARHPSTADFDDEEDEAPRRHTTKKKK